MYYILTPTKGLRVLAQQVLFKKGYRWSDGLQKIREESKFQTICIGTRLPGSITYLDESGKAARVYMRRERPGSRELSISELNKLESV